MCVFLAASDETDEGHHRSKFWHAGFIAPEKDWFEYFTPAWREHVLDASPSIPYLHVSEMRNRRRDAEDHFPVLSDAEVENKLNAAGNVIDLMGSLIPIGVRIDAGVFLDLFKKYKAKPNTGGKAKRYLVDHLCFQSYAFIVLKYVFYAFPEAERVDFLLDRKDGVFDHQKEFYESMKEVLPALGEPHLVKLFGEIIPGGKERVPLQAADFLCWHTMRAKTLEGRAYERYYKIAHRSGVLHEYPYEDLKKLADAFKENKP